MRTVLNRTRERTLAIMLVVLALTISFHSRTTLADFARPVVDTGLTLAGGVSMDSDRVVGLTESSYPWPILVYDVPSSSLTSFPGPASVLTSPVISGDRIVVAGGPSYLSPFGIYYCLLPHASPIQPCGPWQLIVSDIEATIDRGIYVVQPVVRQDLVVWAITGGFAFYRFTSGEVTTVMTDYQPFSPNTNGALITFTGKANQSQTSTTVMYYDSTALFPRIIDTGFASQYSTSISQSIVAFMDNSTSLNRIRYYDVLRDQVSPPGIGPGGFFSLISEPAIWGDNIVFFRHRNRTRF